MPNNLMIICSDAPMIVVSKAVRKALPLFHFNDTSSRQGSEIGRQKALRDGVGSGHSGRSGRHQILPVSSRAALLHLSGCNSSNV